MGEKPGKGRRGQMRRTVEIKEIDKRVIVRNKEKNGAGICECYFIEEAAELIKELTKARRGLGDREEIKKEIADVYYTLSMLRQEHKIPVEEINECIEIKENRAKTILGIEETTSLFVIDESNKLKNTSKRKYQAGVLSVLIGGLLYVKGKQQKGEEL